MSGGRGGTNAGLIIAAIIGAVAVVVGALITARSNVERMEVLATQEALGATVEFISSGNSQPTMPPTATPTLIPSSFTSPTFTPTMRVPPTHELSNATCPPTAGAEFLDSGRSFSVILAKGCYYHFNLSCDGCVQDQEDNIVIYYGGENVEVTVPEPGGSAWRYSYEPSSNDICRPEDRAPTSLPPFLNILGVEQRFLCE